MLKSMEIQNLYFRQDTCAEAEWRVFVEGGNCRLQEF